MPLGRLVRKEEDFSEWYNAAIERADLTDKRYPIKGMNVWTGYGFAVMRRMDERMRSEMVRTGHQEVSFPTLIPETEFKKESEHIKGFEEEVYWVTHAGKNLLDVRLCLRPTSEAAMYPIFALWVRSHADLPLKTFQIVNTYRYDTKQTRAFMRVREIHFFEAHTCHVDAEDAERQVRQDLEVMGNLARAFCVPYLLNKRPDWDKFPGAHYSLACDAVMPTGKTLQVATIHHYRDNFAKAYDVKYETTLVEYAAEVIRAEGYAVTRDVSAGGGVVLDLLALKGDERISIRVRDAAVDEEGLLEAAGVLAKAGEGTRILIGQEFGEAARLKAPSAGLELVTLAELNAKAVALGLNPFARHTYVHQTTYGMSERLLGAIVALHGDDKGFTLPPEIAPIQVVVVPILAKGDQERIGREARALADSLGAEFRIHVDSRDVRPGAKFYEWEAKGVPLRVELGPRDLEQGVVTAVRRDTGEKAAVPRATAAAGLRTLLDTIQENLYTRAEAAQDAAVKPLTSLEDEGEGVRSFPWCGEEPCTRRVEEATELKILGTPFDAGQVSGNCLVCKKPAKSEARAARTY